MQNNEIKKEIYEKRKNLYEANKQLIEIDPNLIILIKLKWLEAVGMTIFPSALAYLYLFKSITKTKRFIMILSGLLFVNFHIYKYHAEELPHIYLKHAKQGALDLNENRNINL
jgi:hypothetical protein